jgi:hypothetical protein
MRGKVIERELSVYVEGERHFMPKGCDPIIGPQLEAFAGKEVDVLMAKDVVLAIRALEPEEVLPLPPIIICYLCPPHIVFDPKILMRIEPLITESLLESGYLDKGVVEQLHGWQAEYR